MFFVCSLVGLFLHFGFTAGEQVETCSVDDRVFSIFRSCSLSFSLCLLNRSVFFLRLEFQWCGSVCLECKKDNCAFVCSKSLMF